MTTRDLPNKIAGLALGTTLLLGIGVASSTTSYAQDRNNQDRNNNGYQDRGDRDWNRYGNYGGSVELRETALNTGYYEGVREGTNDRQNGKRSNFRDFASYRNATLDYNSRFGNRELYRRYFREAFESGFNADGYSQNSRERDDRYRSRDRTNDDDQNRRGRNSDGYGNYGGSFQLRQTALNAGFAEGLKTGRDDHSKGNNPGFNNRREYQNATKDYSSKLGDRELYRRYYREAYENGYRAGALGY